MREGVCRKRDCVECKCEGKGDYVYGCRKGTDTREATGRDQRQREGEGKKKERKEVVDWERSICREKYVW